MTDASGCSATGSVEVVVNALPQPEAQSNTPVCEGADILLTAVGGDSYSWSGPNGYSSIEQNPVILNAGQANAGEYSVVATSAEGCSAQVQTVVSVTPLPEAEAAGNGPVCENETILLSASGGETYSWSGPDGFNSSEQNPVIPNAQLTQGGAYTVIVTTNGCSATASVEVAVTPLPNATANGTSPVCEGAILQLQASGGSAYFWSGPNGFTSDLPNPLLSDVQLSNAGEYSVVVTENGCSAMAEFTLEVNALPIPVVANDGPACEGADIQLLASGGETYSWTGPNGFSSSEPDPLIAHVEAEDAGIYQVTVSSSAGCSSTAETVVEVNVVTASITVVNESCNDCNDGSAAASGSGAGTFSYLWSNGSTEQTITGLEPGTYWVTVSGDNGCSAVVSAVILPFGCPTIEIGISLENPLCFGEMGSISATPVNGTEPYTYLWSNGDTTQTVLVPAGPYSVAVMDAAGCPATALAVVTQPDELTLDLEASPESCAGACDGALTAVVSGGVGPYAFLWSSGDTDLCAGTHQVTITDFNGCSVEGEAEVQPGLELTASIEGDTLICEGEEGLLTASGGSDYLWSTGDTTTSIVWTEPGEYSVTVKESGCSAGAGVSVAFYPELVLEFSISGDTLFAGVTGGAGNYAYLWNTGDTSSWIIPTEAGIYGLTVTDQAGCVVSGETDFTVSVREASRLPIRIYPNPTLHSVFVEMPAGLEGWILVYDLLGNRIVSQPTSIGEVDLSGQAPGTFMLQVVVGQEVFRVKVVRQ